MLATSALGTPGVCVYKWRDGALAPVVELSHFGANGATAAVLNCNNQVVASSSLSGEVVLSLPEPGRASPLFQFVASDTALPSTSSSSLSPASSAVRAIDFDPTSRYLGCVGDFEGVCIWDLKKKKKVRDLRGHTLGACSVAFSTDGQVIGSGGASGAVLVHSVREKHIVCTLDPPSTQAAVGQLAFSSLRPAIVGVAYRNGGLAVFNTASTASPYTPIALWAGLHTNSATGHDSRLGGALSFSPINHKFLASAGADGVLAFADYDTSKVSVNEASSV